MQAPRLRQQILAPRYAGFGRSPALVFASMLLGHPHPLDLHFTPLEIMAVIFAVGVLALVAQDGETHWMLDGGCHAAGGVRDPGAGVLQPARGWFLKRLAVASQASVKH